MTFKACSRALTSLVPLALLACSDPSPPIAQGGVYYETSTSPTSSSACAIGGGFTAGIGNPPPDGVGDQPGKSLVNGDKHAKVTCSASGGDTVKFSGEIEGANSTGGHGYRARLTIRGTLNADGTGTANVSALVEGLTYSSQEPCTLQGVIRNGENQFGDGLVWTTFRCPSMSDGSPNNVCQTKGAIVLENCK